jgi:hypothetical protein
MVLPIHRRSPQTRFTAERIADVDEAIEVI